MKTTSFNPILSSARFMPSSSGRRRHARSSQVSGVRWGLLAIYAMGILLVLLQLRSIL